MEKKTVDYYMGLPYTVELEFGRVTCRASVKELRGCKATVEASESVEELWRLLKEDQRKRIEELLERGEEVPEPTVADPFWENVPDDIGEDEVRSMLYTNGAVSFPLRVLGELWAQELQDLRLTEVAPPGVSPKAGPYHPDQTIFGRENDLRPVRLGKSGKGAWVKLDGTRTTYGYRDIEVLDQPLRTEAAVVAALTVLETSTIRDADFERLRWALLEYVRAHPELEEKTLRDVLGRLPTRWFSAQKAAVDEEAKQLSRKERKKRLGQSWESWERDPLLLKRSLTYMVNLYRHHRPDFDVRPLEEQLDLLNQHRKRINEFLEKQRDHMRFLEYGTIKGLPTRVVERARDQVKAAVLKDVEGLSLRQIADKLDVMLDELDEDRYEKVDRKIPEVNRLIEDGQRLLSKVLSREGGWRKQAECMKVEAERYRSLTKEEKEIEALAENMGWTVEDTRSFYRRNPEMARFLLDTSARF